MTEEHPASHPGMSLGNKLALGTAALAGGIIISPYLLPALGVGDELLGEKALNALCGSGEATGLAGSLKEVLADMPMIGDDLAKGGWVNAATVTATGLGGHFLAKKVSEVEGDSEGICWSKIIRYTALATTALIALPSILTGISAGLTYLTALLGDTALASDTMTTLSETLGTTGSNAAAASGLSGLAAASPHLLTCGLTLFPATLPFLMRGDTPAKAQEIPSPHPTGNIAMEVEPLSDITPGQPAYLAIRLFDTATGYPIHDEDLAVFHERKMHLFAVNDGLQEYHHLHPTPTGVDGEFVVQFTPQGNAGYHIWAEAMQAGREEVEANHAYLPATVPDSAPPARFDFRPNQRAAGAGITCEWSASPPLRQGQESIITVRVTDANGQPVTDLEPFLGATAHMAGFSADGLHLLHLHPMTDSNPLQFHALPEHAGATRFFLQLHRQGQKITTSFDQPIFPAKQQAEQFAARFTPQHAHGR